MAPKAAHRSNRRQLQRRAAVGLLPTRPWDETPAQLGARLRRIASEINAEHDVPGLCSELPMRVEKLRLRRGRKLKK